MDIYSDKMEFNSEYNKLKIKFKSQRKYLYTGWEINQITHSINVAYYKNELLNSISSLLKNNVDPKNIFILNTSVKVGAAYKSLKNKQLDLSKPEDAVNFYYMGSPIALIPNEKMMIWFELFEFYRYFYKECKKIKLTPPIRKVIVEEFINNTEIFSDSASLKKYIEEQIRLINEDLFNKDTDLESKLKELLNKVQKRMNEVSKTANAALLIRENNLNNSKSISKEKLEKYPEIHKYFKLFTENFEALDRPFVGIYNPETQVVEFLCTDLIAIENFTDDNYRFFETKLITQNSPLEIMISVGLGFAPAIIKIGEAIINSRRALKLAKTEELERQEQSLLLEKEIQDNKTENQKINDEIEHLKEEVKQLDQEIETVESNVVNNQVVSTANKIVKQYIGKESLDDTIEVISSKELVDKLIEHNNNNIFKTLEEKNITLEGLESDTKIAECHQNDSKNTAPRAH